MKNAQNVKENVAEAMSQPKITKGMLVDLGPQRKDVHDADDNDQQNSR
jgi:hypothetical protein